jgi:hypothetical protein
MVLTAIGFLWLWYIREKSEKHFGTRKLTTSVTRNPALWFRLRDFYVMPR